MKDPRVEKLADILVNYSCRVQPGENVLIEAYDIPDDVVTKMVDAVVKAKGRPFVSLKHNRVTRAIYHSATEEQMILAGEFEANRMKNMQAYIGLRGTNNSMELSDVPDDKMKLYRKHWCRLDRCRRKRACQLKHLKTFILMSVHSIMQKWRELANHLKN